MVLCLHDAVPTRTPRRLIAERRALPHTRPMVLWWCNGSMLASSLQRCRFDSDPELRQNETSAIGVGISTTILLQPRN